RVDYTCFQGENVDAGRPAAPCGECDVSGGVRGPRMAGSSRIVRCHWATSGLNIPYHDEEWGVPLHDDRGLFEFVILEGAQAGLSWETISNAQAFLKVQEEFGSFDAYIWRFVDGKPKQNAWKAHKHVPAKTAESDAMSKDLQKHGFRFVGSTICYAFMQA